MKRTCMVTGASRGIGLATARRFAQAGFDLVIAARGATELEAAAGEVRKLGAGVEALPVDISTPAAAAELVDVAVRRFGRIDVLVNNAGNAPLTPIERMSDEAFNECLHVNVSAVFFATRAAWPVMRDQGGGVIVNVSSMASLDPFQGFGVYGACKAWVNLFTHAAASEGRSLGIRVFAVAPGAVETVMLRANFPEYPERLTIQPDEVAAAIEGVCDPRFARASGQTIVLRN